MGRTMNLEIEAKMRLEGTAVLAAGLAALGARCEGKVLQRNDYYDTPDRRLRRQGQGLRVRVEHGPDRDVLGVVLTYKGPRRPGPLKTRPETELRVDDAAAAADLLEALGHQRVFSFEKRRETWRLNNCHVEIDTLPLLGCFVEIEGPDEKAVLDTRQHLGLGDEPLIAEGYFGLLRKYMKDNDLMTDTVIFEDEGKEARRE